MDHRDTFAYRIGRHEQRCKQLEPSEGADAALAGLRLIRDLWDAFRECENEKLEVKAKLVKQVLEAKERQNLPNVRPRNHVPLMECIATCNECGDKYPLPYTPDDQWLCYRCRGGDDACPDSSGPARFRNEAGQLVEDDDIPDEDWPR
jgi:hypothetical protein